MMDQKRAARWLVLNNLLQGWPYYTNLDRGLADEALAWAEQHGHVKDGQLTEAVPRNLGWGMVENLLSGKE